MTMKLDLEKINELVNETELIKRDAEALKQKVDLLLELFKKLLAEAESKD